MSQTFNNILYEIRRVCVVFAATLLVSGCASTAGPSVGSDDFSTSNYDYRSNTVGEIDISTLTASPQRKVVMMQFDRPLPEVFEFLLQQVDVYSDDIMDVEFDNAESATPDTIGQGSVRICTMKKGKKLYEPLVVYKQNEYYAYTTDPKRSTMKLPIRDVLLFYTFEEKGENTTLVTVRAHFMPDVFLPMRPVVNTVFNRNIVKTFAGAIEQLGGRFINL